MKRERAEAHETCPILSHKQIYVQMSYRTDSGGRRTSLANRIALHPSIAGMHAERDRKPLRCASAALVGLTVLGSIASTKARPQNTNRSSAGESAARGSTVETLRITSKVFQNTRTIRVLLPPGYDEPDRRDRRYPTLYLTDGITAFNSPRFDLRGRVEPLIRNGSVPAL